MDYDVLIIGGGPGGAAAARHLAKNGRKVGLISDELGGECLNYGCIPTKTYLWTAELLEKLRENGSLFGIEAGSPQLNWQQLKERRADVVRKLSKQLAFVVERSGATIIQGRARFKDAQTLTITPLNSEENNYELTAEKFIIATGSLPTQLPGFDWSEKILSNHEILDLPLLPKNLLVIGGGAIGVEFASVFSAFGVEVSVAEASDRLLPLADAEVAQELERVFAKKKITVLKDIRISPEQAAVYDKVLIAVGRTPATGALGLEAAGLTVEHKGIPTNAVMQTSLPHIYAIGDVAGKALLAYTAEREGTIAAQHILGKNPAPLRYETVPTTIFSLPEVAFVGATEEQVKDTGRAYRVGKSMNIGNAKALIMAGREGFAKVLIDSESNQLLGIHMIGEKASELIAEASLALTNDMSLESFTLNLHSHPILGEILKEACEELAL
ncbi:dihydrolipoyl dehydrogenase [Candidatus Peregrinibacteria bacterium CG_4_9_14_0_2_um_filter_53_11]|nr:MAG: dihydrolipoyl dehydrogenase [Candidatus Peregrinibacteria bacterium CG_4_9_14_0_2_um_filter_53_11]